MTPRIDGRPARGASRSGLPEVNAATKLPVLAHHSTGNGATQQADCTADPWAVSAWRTAIRYLASTGRPFSADDGHELGAPMPNQPGALGGLFKGAVQNGAIRPIGYVPSRRPSRRGGVHRLYTGVSPR
jgi:hypothetical protein